MQNSKADKIRTAFSKFTLLLTVAFGLITTLTLIEEPSRTLQTTAASTAGGRGVASLAAAVGTSATNKPFMATFVASCDDNSSFKTQSEHVRVKGSFCRSDVLSTTVRNSSNGYVATVFHQGGQNYTTDYMSLAHGANVIVIEQKMNSGEVSAREVTIVRE